MNFKSYRESRGLSQQDVATALGLKSKGQISSLESGTWDFTLRLALEVEVWSGGEVTALSLLKGADRELLRRAIAREAAAPAETVSA